MILWFIALRFFTAAEQYVSKPMKSELATICLYSICAPRNAEEHLLFPYIFRLKD